MPAKRPGGASICTAFTSSNKRSEQTWHAIFGSDTGCRGFPYTAAGGDYKIEPDRRGYSVAQNVEISSHKPYIDDTHDL